MKLTRGDSGLFLLFIICPISLFCLPIFAMILPFFPTVLDCFPLNLFSNWKVGWGFLREESSNVLFVGKSVQLFLILWKQIAVDLPKVSLQAESPLQRRGDRKFWQRLGQWQWWCVVEERRWSWNKAAAAAWFIIYIVSWSRNWTNWDADRDTWARTKQIYPQSIAVGGDFCIFHCVLI